MQKEISKCPACGALRSAFVAQCPECGYDFQSKASKVVDELESKFLSVFQGGYEASKRKAMQLEIIKSFAIPQIKEEILDLLIYIQPKATAKNSVITAEWRARQKEVINRAKIAFANEKAVMAKVGEYENELQKLEKQFILNWWQKASIFAKAGVVLGILFILLLIIPAKDVSPEAYAVRFANAVEDKNVDKALDYLKKSPEMGELISDQYLTLIDELIAEGRIVEVENLYNNLRSYVNVRDNATHLSQTTSNLVEYYLVNNNLDKATKYATDVTGIIQILKHLIQNADNAAALKYYKRNLSRLTKYDSSLRKRVLVIKDEVVEEFLNSQE